MYLEATREEMSTAAQSTVTETGIRYLHHGLKGRDAVCGSAFGIREEKDMKLCHSG